MQLKRLFIAALLMVLTVSSSYSQNTTLSDIQKNITEGEYSLAQEKLKAIKIKQLSMQDKALYYYATAKTNEAANNDEGAYKNYLIAQRLYRKCGHAEKAVDLNPDIAYLLFSTEGTKNNYTIYLDDFFAYAVAKKDSLRLAKAHQLLANFKMAKGDFTGSLASFKKALTLNNGKDQEFEVNTINNLAVLYNEYLEKSDSALYYLNKNLKYIKQKKDNTALCYNYINRAAAYYYLGNSIKAIQILKQADSIPLDNTALKTKQCIYEFMAANYEELEDYTNAYKYQELNKKFSDSINAEKQNIAINDIQTKYQTKEKEIENKLLKRNAKTNRILIYTALGLLISSLAIAYLIFKNSRKREKIAVQDKLIEQQKMEKALKEYELNSIDLMLEGQEKERERIANDLHDNLGSMLATLKLNFENLKLRKNELRDDESKLYERTDELIEEAYQKVRRLAHAKNAGVIANDGLLPAIEKLAERLSIPQKLKIDVVHFGFEGRLENTLEISIFRMVQELATNIIKHAGATEATIHLTHHDDIINLIIEDNGRGFKEDKTVTYAGMGLQSIKKKVAQLGGTMEIDSTPFKGTTIIIDIPS